MSLSDDLCRYFFKELSRAQPDLNYIRDTSSNIGAATATILGLSGAGGAITGGTAAGFGLFENQVESTVSNFIFTPDAGEVEQLVLAEKLKSKRELQVAYEAKPDDYNFYSSRSALESYNNICSPQSVQYFVKSSIKKQPDKTNREATDAASKMKDDATALLVDAAAKASTADAAMKNAAATAKAITTADPDEKKKATEEAKVAVDAAAVAANLAKMAVEAAAAKAAAEKARADEAVIKATSTADHANKAKEAAAKAIPNGTSHDPADTKKAEDAVEKTNEATKAAAGGAPISNNEEGGYNGTSEALTPNFSP
ncbi:MAG: hypothetical protein EXR08_01325 [Alphaproteobacteria bacterium]|nr:hypothetical protein [Alphaproteobacteria bacterium]